MKNVDIFDVLVVYNSEAARSAGDSSYKGKKPFPLELGSESYNYTYKYFLKTCREYGLQAALTTSNDIVDNGTCKSYWLHDGKNWKKVRELCYSRHIFDKFSPTDQKKVEERARLFSSEQIQPFNSKTLSTLFADKLKTYNDLPYYSIPTVSIDSVDQVGVERALDKLNSMVATSSFSHDFSKALILKDRFGAGGNSIFKVTDNHQKSILDLCRDNPELSFVIQPFLEFEKGYSFQGKKSATDIRLIYQNGQMIQAYIRMAKTNDFRCNLHQGGTLIYIDPENVPKRVVNSSEKIVSRLGKESLFALDFAISDRGRVYLIEGNANPGINWDPHSKEDETMSKELIVAIVEEISNRVSKRSKFKNLKVPVAKPTEASILV